MTKFMRSIGPSLLLLVSLVFYLITVGQAVSPVTYNLQVGAMGNIESINNSGLRAEIRMNLYHVKAPEDDSFWVGENLANDRFIQFGYGIEPQGNYCVSTEVGPGLPRTCSRDYLTVNGSEPLWFWSYFPNASYFYYGLGKFGLDGVNGSWHVYSINPNSNGEWAFVLDGHQIVNTTFLATRSKDQAGFIAEKVTNFTTPGQLGPVEFRNLAYLKPDGWHAVTGLYAIVNCGMNPSCIPIPYGVSLLGPNHIIAGSGVLQPKDGELLWSSTAQTTSVTSNTPTSLAITPTMPELLFGGLTVVALSIILVFEFVVLPRRKHTKELK